jgi:hypothetical protein
MGIPRRDGCYIWATWLASVLSGSNACVWSAAFKSHFKYDKIPDPSFDSAAYSADHQALVMQHVDRLSRDGWACAVEEANAFRIVGETATLAGKPDIVAQRDRDVLIVDTKTGKKRDDHWWQVLVYMAAWPLWAPTDVQGKTLRGEVAYRTESIDIAAQECGKARRAEIWGMVKTLAAIQDLAPTPSPRACRFCDIPIEDCPSRWQASDRSSVSTRAF